VIKSVIRFTLASIIGLVTALPLYADAEKFSLDNQHSYVLWEIEHLGFSKQVGKWYVDGFVILDKEHPDQSKVEATVNIANIVTGLPELDKHLKGKEFFDVVQFPKATFISNKVDVIDDTSAKVTGTLTLHGIAKPVVLMVKLNKTGKNLINDKTGVGFTATTSIKRSDFGMTTFLPSLGDDVTIQIGAEAYTDKKA
jgi:polyisoprenoid-binding protein YceI